MTNYTAIDRLHALMRDDDDASFLVRQIMIGAENAELEGADIQIIDDIRILIAEIDSRDENSLFCLELSLCPLHFIDYAICFDDETPECAPIRECFPTHDT